MFKFLKYVEEGKEKKENRKEKKEKKEKKQKTKNKTEKKTKKYHVRTNICSTCQHVRHGVKENRKIQERYENKTDFFVSHF